MKSAPKSALVIESDVLLMQLPKQQEIIKFSGNQTQLSQYHTTTKALYWYFIITYSSYKGKKENHKIDIKHELWEKKYKMSQGQFMLDDAIPNSKALLLN